MLNKLKSNLINIIYPPRCLACVEMTNQPHGLCSSCWRETHFIAGNTCFKCGMSLVGEAEDGDLCESCLRHPPAWDEGAAAMVYRGAGRRMVLSLKHGDRLDLVKPLAGWMAGAGRSQVSQADYIAPVPLHWRRLLKRRFNQSAELSRALARISGKPAMVDLLQRTRYTTPQKKMNRDTRMENQSGAFRVNPKHLEAIKGRTIVLLDDVLTTGSTLSCCAETLKSAGAGQVNILVLSRVAFEDSMSI